MCTRRETLGRRLCFLVQIVDLSHERLLLQCELLGLLGEFARMTAAGSHAVAKAAAINSVTVASLTTLSNLENPTSAKTSCKAAMHHAVRVDHLPASRVGPAIIIEGGETRLHLRVNHARAEPGEQTCSGFTTAAKQTVAPITVAAHVSCETFYVLWIHNRCSAWLDSGRVVCHGVQ